MGELVIIWCNKYATTGCHVSASVVTPSADTTVSNGVYVPAGIANGDVKSAVSTTPLADFLMQLEEYTPTVSFCPYQIEQKPLSEKELPI